MDKHVCTTVIQVHPPGLFLKKVMFRAGKQFLKILGRYCHQIFLMSFLNFQCTVCTIDMCFLQGLSQYLKAKRNTQNDVKHL